MTVGTTNIDISKIVKARGNMATRWIKENDLANALEEPADDIVIINALKKVLDTNKNLGELHDCVVLRLKGINVK